MSPSEEREVVERLDAEAAQRDDLLAVSHVHRYRFAAELLPEGRVVDLCCGSGYGSSILAERVGEVVAVDVDDEAIRATREHNGARPVTAVRADAVEYLRGLGPDEVEAIVCFEGIEHVDDPAALLEELRRLADGGVILVLSIPNSKGFEETNAFHKTDFGWEETVALLAPLRERLVMLSQYLAEGSVIGPSTMPSDVAGRLIGGDDAPVEWANHWIVAVNVRSEVLEQAKADFTLHAELNHNRYMRALEGANEELLKVNARLGRPQLGVYDSAAAGVIAKLEERVRRAEERADLADKRLDTELREWWSAGAKAAVQPLRYRTADAIRDGLAAMPGVGFVLRRRRRRLGGG